ncbi:MAG: hypothetical protein H6738_16535 [Alphaproteobacteria bacterium]|nr:hypothetical protein [Alphaproteobacteria bacterium]MCB9698389.1 hypothetical protein [Alphaproteobacteria bacterium]
MAVTTDLDGFRVELIRPGLDARPPWRETAAVAAVGAAVGAGCARVISADPVIGAFCGLAVAGAVAGAGWFFDRPTPRDERLVVEVQGTQLTVTVTTGIVHRLPIGAAGSRPARALGRVLSLALPGRGPIDFQATSAEEVAEAVAVINRRCEEAASRADPGASAVALAAVRSLMEER